MKMKEPTAVLFKWMSNGPLARYVKLRVAHAPGMSGTFSPPPQVSDPGMGPSDTYMHQWSSLVQIMVCRLVGNKPVFKLLPEYMLNGSGVYVKWVTGNYFQLYSNRNEYIFIQKNPFANVACEMASILSRPQCVKYMIDSWFCKHYMELHVSTITTL